MVLICASASSCARKAAGRTGTAGVSQPTRHVVPSARRTTTATAKSGSPLGLISLRQGLYQREHSLMEGLMERHYRFVRCGSAVILTLAFTVAFAAVAAPAVGQASVTSISIFQGRRALSDRSRHRPNRDRGGP